MGVVFLFSIKMHTLSLHTLVVVKVVSQQSELCVLCAWLRLRTFLFYGGKENEKDIESYIDYNIANCFFI